MDFKQLISVASMKQKTKEKELATTKVGVDTRLNNKASSAKKRLDDEKQKKIAKIMARVEAQSKKPAEPKNKPENFNDTIMDFTGTGLSENDTRRRKLNEKELAKKRAEFALKTKHLKENPIRVDEDEDAIPDKVDKHSSKSDNTNSSANHDMKKSSSNTVKMDKSREESSTKDRHRDKHKHKHKEKHKDRNKDKHKDKHRDKHRDGKDSSGKEMNGKHKPKLKLPNVEADIVSVAVRKPALPAPTKTKKPTSAPPPMSFADLLSAAKKNKDDPNAILEAAKPPPKEVKVKEKVKAPEESTRPMTQEEKDRMQRKKSAEYQRWLQRGGPRPASCPPPRPRARERAPISQEIVAESSSDEEPSPPPKAKSKPTSQPIAYPKRAPGPIVQGSIDHKPKYQKSKSIFVPHSKEQRELALAKAGYSTGSLSNGDRPGHNNQGRNKTTPVKNGVANNHSRKPENAPAVQKDSHLKVKSSTKSQPSPRSDSESKVKHKDSPQSTPTKKKQEVKSSAQSKDRPIKKQAAVPPQRARPVVEPPTNPWDRIYGQIQKNHPRPEKNKRRANVIDSESEYDSELDDFIDDDDDFIDDSGAGDNYSRHIQEIFRYDKRKYQHIDEDDVSDMEAGFEQQMQEEARSAKIGLMEDLEDMRMEEEENRRKQLLKKQKAKKLKAR